MTIDINSDHLPRWGDCHKCGKIGRVLLPPSILGELVASYDWWCVACGAVGEWWGIRFNPERPFTGRVEVGFSHCKCAALLGPWDKKRVLTYYFEVGETFCDIPRLNTERWVNSQLIGFYDSPYRAWQALKF